jgi:hypothetical protein
VLLGFGVMMTAIFAAVMQCAHEKYHLELDQPAASMFARQIVPEAVGRAARPPGAQSRLPRSNPGVSLMFGVLRHTA